MSIEIKNNEPQTFDWSEIISLYIQVEDNLPLTISKYFNEFLHDLQSTHELYQLVSPMLSTAHEEKKEAIDHEIKKLGLDQEPDPEMNKKEVVNNFMEKLGASQPVLPEGVALEDLFSAVSDFAKTTQRYGISEGLMDIASFEGLQSLHLINLVKSESKIDHSHRLFKQHIVVLLVARFDDFVANVLRSILYFYPGKLSEKSNRTINLEQAIAAASKEEIIQLFVEKEVDTLMRGSHSKQLKYFQEKLGINILKTFKNYSMFIELTERRNLYAHAGGIVNEHYVRNCLKEKINIKGIESGKLLEVDDEYLERTILLLFELCLVIEQECVRKLQRDELESTDDGLISMGVNYIKKGQLEHAKIIFDYALTLDKRDRFNDSSLKQFIINRALVHKIQGEESKARKLLDSEDWSSSKDLFVLSVRILKEDYCSALKILEKIPISTIPIESYFVYPLFDKFRYIEGFKEILHSKDPEKARALFEFDKQRNS